MHEKFTNLYVCIDVIELGIFEVAYIVNIKFVYSPLTGTKKENKYIK